MHSHLGPLGSERGQHCTFVLSGGENTDTMKPYSIKKHERGQQILCIHNSSQTQTPKPKSHGQSPNRTHKTKDNIRHAERASILRGCVLKSPLWMAVISCRPSIRSSSSLSLASRNAKYSVVYILGTRAEARLAASHALPLVAWGPMDT